VWKVKLATYRLNVKVTIHFVIEAENQCLFSRSTSNKRVKMNPFLK